MISDGRICIEQQDILVVATTCQNSTCSLLTSAKLSVGYLVVGITRELNKEPSLYCSSIYTTTSWSVLQQYLLALMSIPLPHVLLLRPLCHIYVPWHHTLNLCCTCVHYMYTMRNSCPLTSSLTLTCQDRWQWTWLLFSLFILFYFVFVFLLFFYF